MFKMQRQSVAILTMTLLLLAAIFIAVSNATTYTPKFTVQTLDDGWTCTVRGRQVDCDSPEQLSRAAGIRLKRGDAVTLERVLPTLPKETPSPSLFLDVQYASLEVFLDGELLESYDTDLIERKAFISSKYYYIDLPHTYAGSTIRMVYRFGEDNANYDIPAPKIGGYEDLLKSFISQYRYPLFSGAFMVVFGLFFVVVSLLFSTLIPEVMGQMVSAVISLDFGVWVLTTFRLTGLFMIAQHTSVYDYIAYFQFVPLFYILIYQIHDIPNMRAYRIIAVVSAVISEGLIALHFLNIFHITQLRILYYATAVVMMAILLSLDARDIKDRRMDVLNVLQMTGPTLFCVFGLIAMLIYTTGGFFRNAMPSDASLFCFTTGCMSFVLTRFLIYLLLLREAQGRRLEFDSLNQIANVDTLTGLYNRNYAEDMFELLDGGRRNYGLVSMDLNHLKYVNDTFGHAKGDALLIAFADVVKGVFPESASCCRVGGDEFLVIVEGRSASQIEACMNRTMQEFAALDKTDPMIPHSVAGGFAMHQEMPEENAHAVYMSADRRMYERKQEQKRREGTAYASVSEDIQPAISMEQEFNLQNNSEIDEDAKRRLDTMFLALSTAADDATVYLCDLKYDYSRWSKGAVEYFGMPGEYMNHAGEIWEEHIHPEDKKHYRESVESLLNGTRTALDLQYRALSKEGKYVVCTSRGMLINDKNGVPEYLCGAIKNYGLQSHIDPITGLRNQYGFSDDVTELLQHQTPTRILIIGIMQFTQINDIYGYSYGSRVLNKFGKLVQECAGSSGAVYRMDGARFSVINHLFSEEEMAKIYRLLQIRLKEDFIVDGKRQNLVPNGGLLTIDNFRINALTVANCLNYAINESANRRHGDLVIFRNELTDENRQLLEKFNVIRNSILENFRGFYLCYQYLVDARTEQVTGAEALLRWKSDYYGNVPPGDFVAVLEQDPLFPELGTWILRQAMTDGLKFMERYPGFVMNVNLSYSQLEKYDFVSMVSDVIEDTGFPASQLCLEVTESCRVLDVEMLNNIIVSLKSLGIRFALDDFGTGFSSLSLLRRISFDVVKIDRQFILDIEESEKPRQTVKAIAELAGVYGAKVCVEGVETETARDYLRAYPVSTFQGYLYAKPRPLEELLPQKT